MDNKLLQRRKRVIVPNKEILNLLMHPRPIDKNLVLKSIKLDIPDDAIVVSVYEDPERASFIFIICHYDFDIVEDGVISPEENYSLEVTKIPMEELIKWKTKKQQ